MEWDNNVHVPAHTQAQQPHHLSCCRADTGTALPSSFAGWGGGGERYASLMCLEVSLFGAQTYPLSGAESYPLQALKVNPRPSMYSMAQEKQFKEP